eukprot:5319806-Pyramimonas_sp.AAC.1
MQFSGSTCPPAELAGASRRPSPAAQPSGAPPMQAESGSTTVVSVMPPMLKVRAASQPQPAKWDAEESCSICFDPK